MDVHVDLKVLEAEKKLIEQQIVRFEAVKASMSKVIVASKEDLEGDQFDRSIEAAQGIDKSVDKTVVHLKSLIKDLNCMIECITGYTKCIYEDQ